MEFIKGFDVSTLAEVERCGGKFYDHGRPGDALEILKAYGGNWVRLRLWNDPYGEKGEDYGAGVCDLPTVLALARRAKLAGMDWLLDLHYSDFWADPGKQYPPKKWQDYTAQELEQAVYAYTTDVLHACRAADVTPGMVQVGNELTKGLLWPLGKTPNYDNIARFVRAGAKAVRDFDPSIRIIVHLDNGGNSELYRTWFDEFSKRGGDWDVIGLSYYPFWHGTLEMLAENMNSIALRYGKDLMIVETSMGFTMESYAGYERLPEAAEARKGAATRPALVEKIPFPMTPEGQASYTAALLKVLQDVPEHRGRGFFWWEPAWIPVPGSGWAEPSGWEYVHEQGPGGNEWANQALFDYEGNALPALAVIRDA